MHIQIIKFTKTKNSNYYQRLYYIHVRVFQTSNAIDVIAAQLIHKAIMASQYTDRYEYRCALLCSWNNAYTSYSYTCTLCKCVGSASVTSTVGKHNRYSGMLTVCTSWNASQCLYDSVYWILSVSSD